ncbi:hypothetical protein PsYK624_034780 [Phanerochaete sordida]|uniref:Uncharacterized protein n=1 Tax=Phanerochaete sordida TaxID=48140 RepID=A0A9P3G3W5_9APHY|nr:hypothetical protein PsYK624_034780 [Phanerochaete sordida]
MPPPQIPPVALHDISISETNLIGVWAEGPLYGLTIALYICYTRLFSHELRNLHKTILLGVATFQVILASAHFIAGLVDLIRGFVVHVDDAKGPNGYFVDQNRPAYNAAFFFWATNYIIGDAMMGWRCYIVWGRNRLIGCFYIILLIGLTAMAYANFGLITDSSTAPDIFAATGVHSTIALFCLSMGVQVSATALITWKILRASRWSAMSNSTARRAVVWTVIESGAVLTGATATVLTLFLLKFKAGAMMNPIITQLSFLVPTSIFVRARMKQSEPSSKATAPPGMRPNNVILIQGSPDMSEAETHERSSDGTDITIALSNTADTDVKTDGTSSISSKV